MIYNSIPTILVVAAATVWIGIAYAVREWDLRPRLITLVAAGISLAILSGWGYFIWLLSHMGQ